MGTQLRFLPWRLIWKVKIPYEVADFTWLVVKEAALTQENLRRLIGKLKFHIRWQSLLGRKRGSTNAGESNEEGNTCVLDVFFCE